MADTGHSFAAFFKRATSPLVVLSLLREKPRYGYEISAEMKERSSGGYTLAVLYPILYRLQEQGYVAVSSSEVVDGRSRTYYAITPAGEDYLAQCLREYQKLNAIFQKLTGGNPND